MWRDNNKFLIGHDENHMKKFIFFGFVVFSGLFLMQCRNETEKNNLPILKTESSGFTKITGFIHNRGVYPNTKDIIIYVSHVSGEYRVTQIKTPINDDGSFYFQIDLSCPQDVTMQPYLDFLYLIPGDSLHIELDFKKPRDARLSGGKSAEINRDFFKYFAATGYHTIGYNYSVGTNCEINCSWDEIVKKLNGQRNEYRDTRQTFLRKTRLCDEVVKLTEAMIELDYYSSLAGTLLHLEYRGRDTGGVDKKSLMNELDEVAVKYFNTDLYSNVHFGFIGTYTSAAHRFVIQRNPDTDFVDWANEVAKTDIIKDFMLTVRAGNALLKKDLENFEKISPHVNHEYLLDRLMQEYRVTRAKMVNPENISSSILGNPKDFTNNVSFEDKNFLAKIIAPNYGKIQVINLCAAWCAPCKPVLEQLVTLMKEDAGKNMCFSFICISSDNKETREMYRKMGIDDALVHFTTEDEYHFLTRTFSPISFPYGILVNRKGIIVDNGWYIRPGELLQERINLLLEQDKLIK